MAKKTSSTPNKVVFGKKKSGKQIKRKNKRNDAKKYRGQGR
jgi:hypothetical protein